MHKTTRQKLIVLFVLLGFISIGCLDDVGGIWGEHDNSPPTIDTQPISTTVTDGDAVSFSIVATGSSTLSYQWKKNGVNVGGNSPHYTIFTTIYANDNNAQIVCIITNSGGQTASNVVILTVTPISPTVISHPASITVDNWATASFSVVTSGTKPLSYQWKKNGINVGNNSPNYTTDSTVFAHDNGVNISCVVTNVGGSVNSGIATLTVLPPPLYLIINLSSGISTGMSTISDLLTNDTYKTTHLVLKYISAGTFQMGSSSSGDDYERPVHTVNITKGFYIGVFEITQRQYYLVAGYWPSYFTINCDKLPVESVSWNMIYRSSGFLDDAISITGLNFRLPTEAEWEYACRAGTTTDYYYGNSSNDAYMWYSLNSTATTHEVGTKLPNSFGLYDMHGNVYEWCSDWYNDTYYSTSPANDPENLTAASERVLRGGCYASSGYFCRSGWRYCNDPDTRNGGLGLRVVVSDPE